jgi:type IV secretory pathway VirB2 component (pilin)
MNISNLKDLHWNILIAICLMAIVIMSSDSVFAAASDNDVIGSTLCSLVNKLSGSIAKAIATMAILAVGIGMFMGKLSWGTAALTAAGVGVIFGAGKLVAWLSNATDASNCPTA